MPIVLVTGATGFLGKQVVGAMRAHGHSVTGTTTGPGSPDCLHCNLGRVEDVDSVLEQVGPDIIVHCAALSNVVAQNPLEYYQVNVLGTEAILRAASRSGRRVRFLLISTAGVYGNQPVDTLTENLTPLPVHHYGLSKFAAERITYTYSDRLDVTVIRPFNVIGIGQTAGFILPKLVSHFAAGAREIRLGNMDVYRDYIDSASAAAIIATLTTTDASIGETVNLCTGQPTSLRQLIQATEAVAGYKIDVVTAPEFVRHPEVWKLLGSPDKLIRLLGKQTIDSAPLESVISEMFAAKKAEYRDIL